MSNLRNVSDAEQLAAMFKALSNPLRLRIFRKLMGCCGPGGCCDADDEVLRRCVGDLGSDLGVAPSTVSHHIKELRQAGLMHIERRGQRIECWIAEDALRRLTAFFGEGQELLVSCGAGGERSEG